MGPVTLQRCEGIRRGVLWGCRLLALLFAVVSPLGAGGLDARALRAAAVYKLMLFVAWPSGALQDSHDLVLCVVSGDPDTIRAFASLTGNTVSGRPLSVQRRGALADLGSCHAVYFDDLEPGLLADKLASLAGLPVLTLSATGFGSGAMIDLALVDNRLVFEVSAAELRDAGLVLAARVMQLARKVHP